MKQTKKAVISLLIILLMVLVLLTGIYLFNDRKYYFISIAIIGLTILLFLLAIERRKPQTREVVLLSVMITIAVTGRAAFFMIPQVKPVAAIVIITGCSLSPQAGLLTGVMAAFISNFFFGQGPWTPWQMLGFGLIGYFAGLFFRGERNAWKENKLLLSLFGGLMTLLVYGMIMDTSSALMVTSHPNLQSLLAVYISGFPFNLLHAGSTVLFLYLFSGPMFRKLDRIKRRYGLVL